MLVATWAKELPWVLLGLHVQLREDTGLSHTETVFGTPNEFLPGEEIFVYNILKFFLKTLDAPAFPLSSKHNLSRLLPEELPADLLRAPFIWLR